MSFIVEISCSLKNAEGIIKISETVFVFCAVNTVNTVSLHI